MILIQDNDEARDLAIQIVETLLDECPHLLSAQAQEYNGNFTDGTFELQDTIHDFINSKIQNV
jgi:hypothetical protein